MAKGRPTKLTKELQDKIIQHLKAGYFRKDAAALVAVDEVTLCRWFNRGSAEDKTIYSDFYVAVLAAEAEFKQAAIDNIRESATRNPKLLQWLLSRRFPDQFGRRDNVEIQTSDDKAAAAKALKELLFERLERLIPTPEEPKKEEKPAENAPKAPESGAPSA